MGESESDNARAGALARRPRGRTYKAERLGALSDGIFAIVLTLLVLELQLPEIVKPEDEIAEALAANGHELIGWLISFVVLARMWMIQHDTFSSLKRISSRTILVNFVFLAAVSLVPFAAKFVGTYEFEDPQAIIVFSVMLGLTGLSLGWVVWSANRDALVTSPTHTGWNARIRHHLLVVPVISVVAIALTLVEPAIAMVILAVEAALAIVLLFTGEDPPDEL